MRRFLALGLIAGATLPAAADVSTRDAACKPHVTVEPRPGCGPVK